jgi:hypothetical protein
MKFKHTIIAGLVLLTASLVLGACSKASAPTLPAPVLEATQAPLPTPAKCPEPAACPEPVVKNVPNQDLWASSPHADAKAAAFNHWNDAKANPNGIPVECARCHSTPGYQDYLGADGSAAGVVDSPAITGTVITCVACHNIATQALISVTFPSGVVVGGLGPEARCMECHQGRESKVSVDKAIKDLNLTDADTPSDKLSFINIHYRAAAATLYGAVVKGGYEYDGKSYNVKFAHVDGLDTCVACHDTHSLQVNIDTCKGCHTGVKTVDDLQNIRMPGSAMDYNGNGDTKEGIAKEIEGLQALLMTAIQTYGKEVTKVNIAYDPANYPYFYIDTNGNGTVDKEEAVVTNAYKSWTPRLVEAAYNYQLSVKDPGAFAHNAKYVIQLLYDSTDDLNSKLTTKVDLSKANRDDAGHFNGSDAPFRDWDQTGVVPGTCAKCHAPSGLPTFLGVAANSKDGVTGGNLNAPTGNGMKCSTCHSDLQTFTRYTVDAVKFPSGAVVTFGKGNDANLCISCHQGRESKVSVDAAIKASGATDDKVSDKLSFKNPHYFAAGATLFGTDAKGAYEYDGQKYNGRNLHTPTMQTCTNCHDVHSQAVNVQACASCHTNIKTVDDLKTITMEKTPVDFNGDGKAEGIGQEVDGMESLLYAAIQDYAVKKAGTAIVYDPSAYPYFFADSNGNSKVDDGEKAYASWTPRLLRAAYNYQWVQKDPGTFAHNGKYILQVLYDSLKDLGVNVAKMVRPEVVAAPTP